MSRELDLLAETVESLFPEGCSSTSEMAEILRKNGICDVGITTTSVIGVSSQTREEIVGICFFVGSYFLRKSVPKGCKKEEEDPDLLGASMQAMYSVGEVFQTDHLETGLLPESSFGSFGLIPGKISPLDALKVKRTFSNVFVIFSEATIRLVEEDKVVIVPTGQRNLKVIRYRSLAERLSDLVRY